MDGNTPVCIWACKRSYWRQTHTISYSANCFLNIRSPFQKVLIILQKNHINTSAFEVKEIVVSAYQNEPTWNNDFAMVLSEYYEVLLKFPAGNL